MEVFLQLNKLSIKSLTGVYEISFTKLGNLQSHKVDSQFCIVDRKVYELYKTHSFFKEIKNPIFIDAIETNKTIEASVEVIEKLLECGLTRGKKITAIGGGITQDIATFVCSILFRGVPWTFIPTTLLAQCDSCIGGKSSLNFKNWKNQIGNFYPPERIIISTEFLETLEDSEIRSGIGEMIKVHMLSNSNEVDKMHNYLKKLPSNEVIEQAIYNSLQLKKTVIEQDEFDTGLRLKMNLGHTFGHALEAASHYKIPHGIAVNLGLLIANDFSLKTLNIHENEAIRLKEVITLNLRKTDYHKVNYDIFFDALKKDKKNKENEYCFIIPTKYGEVERNYFPMNEKTDLIISNILRNELHL